ncbi:hypothetical protein KY285_008585 [Solanum tuberosum]|nr:hypothetical protein KY285_008585 [Solanum tuberosum]
MSVLAILFISLILSNFSNKTEAKTFSFLKKQLLITFIKLSSKTNLHQDNLLNKADQERKSNAPKSLSRLHGIPVLVKDNIATKDKLNTTAGSLALVGSIVPQDAGVVKKLRNVGAIILGKATMTEWAASRATNLLMPNGWNGRLGQALDPYVASADPSGSSTGSATSVAANMVAVALGTETAGSILSPSSANSVVGIKPTVGLTSRAGVIPISHRQDTVGPICRTVTDAVEVLDVIVGFDRDDFPATKKASIYIPHDTSIRPQCVSWTLDADMAHKYLRCLDDHFVSWECSTDTMDRQVDVSRCASSKLEVSSYQQKGAVLVDNLVIPSTDLVYNAIAVAQNIALSAEFKMDLNAYLKHLVHTQVRSLADVIAFNKISPPVKYGQDIMLKAEKTNGIGKLEREALRNITKACKYGFEKMMKENKIDALMSPGADIAGHLAIGGYPGINVPAGYDKTGTPFGISFGGLKGSEPTLIEIAYGFEQATHMRKPPPSHPQ